MSGFKSCQAACRIGGAEDHIPIEEIHRGSDRRQRILEGEDKSRKAAEEHTIEYLENVVQTQSHPNFLDESKRCGKRKVRLTCCENVVASLLKIAL